MDGRHGGRQDFVGFAVFQKGLYHVAQAGCRAARGGNHMVPGGIKIKVVDAVDKHAGVIRYLRGFVGNFGGSTDNHLFSPGSQMSTNTRFLTPRREGRILVGPRAIDHQAHPVLAPVDIPGVPGRSEDGDRHPVYFNEPLFRIRNFDVKSVFRIPVQETFKATIGGIPGDGVDNRLESGSHFPPDIHHKPVKMF